MLLGKLDHRGHADMYVLCTPCTSCQRFQDSPVSTPHPVHNRVAMDGDAIQLPPGPTWTSITQPPALLAVWHQPSIPRPTGWQQCACCIQVFPRTPLEIARCHNAPAVAPSPHSHRAPWLVQKTSSMLIRQPRSWKAHEYMLQLTVLMTKSRRACGPDRRPRW